MDRPMMNSNHLLEARALQEVPLNQINDMHNRSVQNHNLLGQNSKTHI